MIPPVRRHYGHSYARHGGCRRRRRDRRDRVRYLIPLRASRFRGVGSVGAGPAANNPGPRAVLRQHAPSATRQRTLEATGSTAGPVFLARRLTPRAERLAPGAPSKANEKGLQSASPPPLRFFRSRSADASVRLRVCSAFWAGESPVRVAFSRSRCSRLSRRRSFAACLSARRPPFLSEPEHYATSSAWKRALLVRASARLEAWSGGADGRRRQHWSTLVTRRRASWPCARISDPRGSLCPNNLQSRGGLACRFTSAASATRRTP